MEKTIEVFKDICVKMYEASDLLEFSKSNHILFGENYAVVVQKVLSTHYGTLVHGGCTLAEVGYILGLTRERTRQIQDNSIGKQVKTGTQKRTGRIGVLSNMTPTQKVIFRDLKDSVS